jgi:ubiquitin carboxyl-terminal hydrolase 48
MEVIVKLLREYGDSAVRNSVGTAFRGKLQNETECLGCHNKTQRQESFSELELGVRKHLNESLDELLKDELLNESNQYFCSVCKMKKDANRRTQLLKLPPVLNLQLMRFVFDR